MILTPNFNLHDQFHATGLEIVGIHVDQGDEEEPVDTVEKLDDRLIKVREGIGKDRDLPYAVGLVNERRTSFGTEIGARNARSEIAARSGVTMYPTAILIERQRNLVKEFDPDLPADVSLLEKLLNDK